MNGGTVAMEKKLLLVKDMKLGSLERGDENMSVRILGSLRAKSLGVKSLWVKSLWKKSLRVKGLG